MQSPFRRCGRLTPSAHHLHSLEHSQGYGPKEAKRLVSHRFALDDIMKAYETFGNATKERTLKVMLTNPAVA